MFYSTKSDKFWRSINKVWRPTHIFYFDESTNDVISLFNHKYQTHYYGPRNMSDEFVVVGSTGTAIPSTYHITRILLKAFQIKLVGEKHQAISALIETTALSKKNYFSPYAVANCPLERSLLPIIRQNKLLWIQNWDYQKSSVYFIETFTVPLWLTFVSFFIGIFLAIWIFQKIINKFKFNHFDVVSLILSQGMTTDLTNHMWATKLIMIFFGFLLVIFYSAYGAFIDSLLAVKKVDAPFRDIMQLYHNSDFVICVKKNSATYITIKRLKLIDKLNVVHMNTKECPTLNKTTGFWIPDAKFKCDNKHVVFLSWQHTTYFAEMARYCAFTPLPRKHFIAYTTMMVSKSFQYREQFNCMLLRILSSGITDYTQRVLMSKDRQSKQILVVPEIAHSNDPISMQQTYLIFILLIVGIWFGAVILWLETIWFRRKK